MDVEQFQRLVAKEAREEDALRVERYSDPRNPDLVAFEVRDGLGRLRGFIGFEYDAMEQDLPERTLQRVQRGLAANPGPYLRLVG